MKFSEKLIGWYTINKRKLPWRETKNPYLIWVSEIILQQTRVEQGLPYYLRFVKKYPTVNHLAKADENEVLKLWQGLGYYTRARNLHHSAKYIYYRLGGKFPDEYSEILKLKGIGRYTAAAISSFAYHLPFPVVDGNVQRILSRIFGIADKINSQAAGRKFYSLAATLMEKKDPGTFNQAIMEFGAMQCIPVNPPCSKCIFRKNCKAFALGKVKELPVKEKPGNKKTRFFNYLVIQNKTRIFLQKRTGNDIWKNLYEFPLVETSRSLSSESLMVTLSNALFHQRKYKLDSACYEEKQVLSHQQINARFWKVKYSGKPLKNWIGIKKSEIINYAMPKLMVNFLSIQ